MFPTLNTFDFQMLHASLNSRQSPQTWITEPDVQLVNLFLRICAERNHSVQINAQDKFGNTPLHEALKKYGQIKWVDYLLRRGADSNLTNADGLSPLHVICQRNEDDDLIEFFVKKCNDVKQTVHFNARDKEGRTPLEYAVSRLLPRVVDVLLAKHANLSGIVFPTAAHFTEILNLGLLHNYHFKLRIASGALSIVEKLESRGYDLDRSNALAIMDLFAKSKVLEKPTNLDESCEQNDERLLKRENFQGLRNRFGANELECTRIRGGLKCAKSTARIRAAVTIKLIIISTRKNSDTRIFPSKTLVLAPKIQINRHSESSESVNGEGCTNLRIGAACIEHVVCVTKHSSFCIAKSHNFLIVSITLRNQSV
ncbi:unnamed protein product [Trichogramma brassicae]|uniref:Uncharacterized protein n=1 Tax=Trichogramma brassicae TaxID=86971 RepID=A0A6H5IYS8_9HYME|nr:unnamed protein product [Trichogramma brassicae]